MNEYNNMYDPLVMNILGFTQEEEYTQQGGGVINTGYGYNNINNMPYYSGNYNYNNPYLIQQQQYEIQKRRNAELEKQDNFIYKLDNIARRSQGFKEFDVNSLNKVNEQYYAKTREEQYQEYEDYMMNSTINFLNSIDNPQHISINKYDVLNQNIGRNLQKAQERLPENATAADCLKIMSEDYIRNKEIEERKKMFTNNYNSKGYSQLLSMNGNYNSYYNGVFGGLDNTVNFTTPDSEYLQRKKMFLDQISKQL